MSSNIFSESRAIYEMMSQNVVKPDRALITKWRRVSCWITKATRVQAHASARAPTPTSTHTHTHVPMHTHSLECTYTEIFKT